MRFSKAEITLNYAILIIFTVIAVFPIVNVFLIAVNSNAFPAGLEFPRSFTSANFREVWNVTDFGDAYISSGIISVSVVALGTAVSVLSGYAFGTMRFFGSKALFLFFLLYYDLRSLQLTDTYWSVILPEASAMTAFGTFWMRAFFRSTPRAIVEAARIDGASRLRILVQVLLPSARPAIETLMVLLFLWSFNAFLLPLVMLQDQARQSAPLAVLLFVGLHQQQLPGLAAASVMLMLPVLILYVIFQRHFIRGMMGGSIVG
jgi:raffinose/stachyose/melibiose transport system permease protein